MSEHPTGPTGPSVPGLVVGVLGLLVAAAVLVTTLTDVDVDPVRALPWVMLGVGVLLVAIGLLGRRR